MISIELWRARIGAFNCRMSSYRGNRAIKRTRAVSFSRPSLFSSQPKVSLIVRKIWSASSSSAPSSSNTMRRSVLWTVSVIILLAVIPRLLRTSEYMKLNSEHKIELGEDHALVHVCTAHVQTIF